MPPSDVANLRASPSWQGRLAAAHTIPRELRGGRMCSPRPASGGVGAPALLLLGGASPPLFADEIAAVQSALPHAHTVVLPGQGHVAMNTAPDLFLRELLSFLEK